MKRRSPSPPDLATRYPMPYKSLGSALKTLIEQTPGKRKRRHYEARLQALKASAAEAKARSKSMRSEQSRVREA